MRRRDRALPQVRRRQRRGHRLRGQGLLDLAGLGFDDDREGEGDGRQGGDGSGRDHQSHDGRRRPRAIPTSSETWCRSRESSNIRCASSAHCSDGTRCSRASRREPARRRAHASSAQTLDTGRPTGDARTMHSSGRSRMKRKLSIVILCFGLIAPLQAAPVQAHDAPNRCGQKPGPGAGWYKVRGHDVSCTKARKSLAGGRTSARSRGIAIPRAQPSSTCGPPTRAAMSTPPAWRP